MEIQANKNPTAQRTCVLIVVTILLIGACAPIVFSPHAQNELIAPYNREGEVHEFGATAAVNAWFVEREEGTLYIKTYPSLSSSLFHNAYYTKGTIGGIAGLELIAFPTTWYVPDASGFVLGCKPYAGFQYSGSNFTLRLNLSPISIVAGFNGGEWDAGGDLNESTFYQVTALVHNPHSARNMAWGGARISAAAWGLVGGYEHALTAKHFLRGECSILMRPPFSLFLSRDRLETIKGVVFYTTFGFFTRVK